MQSSDVLVGFRPTTDAAGNTTYTPFNITAANFSTSIVSMGLLLLAQTWPDSAPEGGGWFLDNGSLSYSAVEGSTSGTPLSASAFASSYAAALAASPAMGASTNFKGMQDNAGVLTQVDDGT